MFERRNGSESGGEAARRTGPLARPPSPREPIHESRERRCAMVRRYDEPVDVQARPGAPDEPDEPTAFVWRGRLYVVRGVLAHWYERRAWWRDTASLTLLGLRADGGPQGAEAATVQGTVAASAATSVLAGAGEREGWRGGGGPGGGRPVGGARASVRCGGSRPPRGAAARWVSTSWCATRCPDLGRAPRRVLRRALGRAGSRASRRAERLPSRPEDRPRGRGRRGAGA